MTLPELGSKISLVSKADIRYEGRLFTVDPQECTIALANVRSFGTEDRETSYPIMPQPTVYDYILFRGSDIKDIRVVNNVAIPNDPAIMQMHLPHQNFPPQQGFPPMQPGAPPMNNFAPFGQMQMGPMGGPMAQLSQQHQPAQSPVQSHQDSRSGTPQNNRKSPVSDMAVQTTAGKDKPQQNQRNNQRNNNNQQPQQRERRDSGRNEGHDNKGGYRQNQNQQQRPMNNQQQQPQRGGYNNQRSNLPNQNQNNGPNNNNGQMRRNPGGSARMPPQNYRHQGPPNQNQSQNQQNRQGSGPQQPNPRGGKPLKFENEFDFEQANTKFEELRAQLQRLKVGEEVKPDQVNGEVEKKDDSGNETGADQEAEHDDGGYDKNKSFFDNISCEAVERSKGKTPRTDWRVERKINSETFGYSFNRRPHFNPRNPRNYYQNRNPRAHPNNTMYRNNNSNQNNYRNNQNHPVRNHRNQNNPGGERNSAPNPGQQSQPAPVAAN